MMNAGRKTLLTYFLLAFIFLCEIQCIVSVWKLSDHGDKGPGCKPKRNGDLWT